MNLRKRQGQAGRINIVTVIVLAAIVFAGYMGYKFIPVYIEKSRISRLVKMAGNNWMNMEPSLKKVREELQYNLDQADVEDITADDVQFAPGATEREGEVWVEYEVEVEHPFGIKPTVLEFYIHHDVKRGMTDS